MTAGQPLQRDSLYLESKTPYKVVKNHPSCPAGKPWGVVTVGSGNLHGCHPTKAAAQKQQMALYVNAPDASANADLDAEIRQEPIMPAIERRYFAGELRSDLSSGKPRLIGHAAVFGQLSDDLGGFRERIQPGAFAETIKKGDIRALWNHDANFVLARTKSGTLKLEEDSVGLKIDATLPDTQFARDLLASISRGDVDQMSFGFRVLPQGDKWEMHDGGLIRTLHNVSLFDVSPVTFPAYPQTDVAVRVMADEMRSKFTKEVKQDDLADHQQKVDEFLKSRECPDPLSLREIIRNVRRIESEEK